jgi:UDP-N-acetylglucosamine 2-epimerase (non-hydrolysing)
MTETFMNKKIIHLIAAARPNFMKVAPLYHALAREKWCAVKLVHTGQHYDANMSDAFFTDLRLPKPDFHLGVGSGTHAEQTGGVMIAYEKICLTERPDMIVVVGDVNSTAACAMVATKLLIPVAHLEAGLRSGDRAMPEEINRLVTDAICDLLWTPSPDADENLRREGVPDFRIERVGNIMMDSYELLREPIEAANTPKKFGLKVKNYGVVTLHRPSNVDHLETLSLLVDQLVAVANKIPLLFAIHPRTRERLNKFGLMEKLESASNITLVEPMSYIPFMSVVKSARMIITDSGGVQEESTYLDIPCLTLRENTERPITVSEGTNRLVRPEKLMENVDLVLADKWPSGHKPDRWDGKTASRIVASLKRHLKV